MSNVHGIKVTGGSFPALIWNGVHDAGAAPCKARDPAARCPWTGRGTADAEASCADTMLLANPRCPNVVEMYLPAASSPGQRCTKH